MIAGWLKRWRDRLGDRGRANSQAHNPKEGQTTGQAETSRRYWGNEETLRRKIVHCQMNVELVSFLKRSNRLDPEKSCDNSNLTSNAEASNLNSHSRDSTVER